jgi:hypothetical protein
MKPEDFPDEEPTQEMPDFRGRLVALMTEEAVAPELISERGLLLATRLLEEVWQRHGDPGQPSYKHRHNDHHALNVIRNSWVQWKPLHDKLPDRFDTEGFELLMIAGAGHDIIYDSQQVTEQAGHNEQSSGDLVYDRMIEAGYGMAAAQRVYDAIIKTTVEIRSDGSIVQTKMREGSQDVLGLVLGRGDMSGILLRGPDELYGEAVALYNEGGHASLKDKLSLNPSGIVSMLRSEKTYLDDRVASLSEDLRYHVEDEAEQALIIQVYREEFGHASIEALQAADSVYRAPEKTRQMVEEALLFAGRAAHRRLDQIAALKRYMIDQARHTEK